MRRPDDRPGVGVAATGEPSGGNSPKSTRDGYPPRPGTSTPTPLKEANRQLLALQGKFRETQYWPPERLWEHQRRQLGLVVDHVYRTRPFYRARLAACGYQSGQEITAEFWQTLPVLTRREVQEHFAAITDGSVPAEHLPYVWDSTSGSSGMPLKIKTTHHAQIMWLAATLREELWHRRDFSAKLAVIRRDDDARPPHGKRFASWEAPVALVYPTGPAVVLDNRSTIEQQATWLLQEQPDYLLTFPSILRELAHWFRSRGLRLQNLRSLRIFGEAPSPNLAELCREVLGVDVTDVYSATEVGNIAFQCPEYKHYHVQSEMILVEVLDDAGRPCGPGASGKVVVTALYNYAMPLLRYAVGDIAEVGAPCGCGRTLPVLSRILGRARDVVVLPSGARRYAYFGSKAIADFTEIVQFQLAQKSLYDLEVRLVTRGAFGATNEEKLRRLLNETLGEHFSITFDYRDAIPHSASGKYLDFVSELPV
ncbi:MAG TPA: AMP-binding protein [Stellaceae bacterium]|nr:AMP-binding protein [Stellaceae bacterium]